jgi:DNA-binding PadR family transcriptional regulator
MPGLPLAPTTVPERQTPDDFLPLKADAFYVLLVLLHGERHGYAIMREAAERSAHRVELQAGALYRLLARMLGDGLVVESQRRPAADADDERRRYYRITPLGKRTIAAEAERMASLAEAARAALRGQAVLA